MLNPDLRSVLKGHISRYSLVTAVAKRARQIAEDPVLSEKYEKEKTVSVALDEFVSGKLKISEPDEIRYI